MRCQFAWCRGHRNAGDTEHIANYEPIIANDGEVECVAWVDPKSGDADEIWLHVERRPAEPVGLFLTVDQAEVLRGRLADAIAHRGEVYL